MLVNRNRTQLHGLADTFILNMSSNVDTVNSWKSTQPNRSEVRKDLFSDKGSQKVSIVSASDDTPSLI